MPNYFGNFEIVSETKNFIVTCDDDAEARVRAQNVGAVCEIDLVRLNDLFSCNFEAGNTSKHTVWVHCLKDVQSASANGWNYGYERTESSRILLQRAFVPPPPSPPPPDPPAVTPPNYNAAVIEFPRFVFVAELAEILMDFTGYGWSAHNSMGEGLSNVLGALLHPVGYYDAKQGPRINQWLNGGGGPPPNLPRSADNVNSTEDTDQNIFSYGCAILFINYLVYQLGYPLKDVIRGLGPTLADTYAKFTNTTAAAAYPAFNTLLQDHIGNTTTNNLLRDNIFPLYDTKHRRVETSVGDPINQGAPVIDPNPVMFDVKPGLICPVGKYGFTKQHQQIERLVYARARGMANASFRWSIEGVGIAARGQWTYITVNKPVLVRNPDGKTQTIAKALTILYVIADSWNGSVLYLKTVTADGNFDMTVSVDARESGVNNDPEVGTFQDVGLDTVTWLAGEEIKKAWKRCNPFYATVDKTIWGMTAQLSDFKNRPDPPSERTLVQIADSVRHLEAAVAQYAKAGNMTTAEVWNQIGSGGGFRSPDAPAADVDLTRLSVPPVKNTIKAPVKKKNAR